MDDDESSRALPPKEIRSDESLVAYLTAEPSFLGNERLLIIGRSILTDVGDIVDLLAIDDTGAVHVIFLPLGMAGDETLQRLIPQGAWVNELDVAGLRDVFAGYRDDLSLDQAFEGLFSRGLPGEVNQRQLLTVVASSISDEVLEALEELSDRSDGQVRAVSFREWDDGDHVIVQTKRLV